MTVAGQPLTRRRIRELLDRHGLGPSRALGQNFLCDPSMVDKIVRLAGIEPGDRVIEIGPGLGSLTVGLATAGASVTALEIDRYLLPALAETTDGLDVTVHNVDAQEADWSTLLGDGPWKVVANLPYNIATPLVLDLLAAQPQLESWVVMVQREAGERLVAEPGTRAAGIPSVLVAHWATGRIVGRVGADLFLPRPKVESVLVRLDRRPQPMCPVDHEALAAVVRAGFGQRRKMIRRSLAAFVTTDELDALDIDPTARAEALTLDQWCRLAVHHRSSAEIDSCGPDHGGS